MKSSKVLFARFVSGVLLLTFGISWGANRYFFEPETLRLYQGAHFEWHMMMETDMELCGYGFTIDAPVTGETILDPDTLTFNWAGTGADTANFGLLHGPDFGPNLDWFGGASLEHMCPPGLGPGMYIAIRIFGAISRTTDYGTYAFWGPHEGKTCDFMDTTDMMIDVPVDTGWIEVIPTDEFLRGDADADSVIAMTDAIYILREFYFPDTKLPHCWDALDVDDSGVINMLDAMYLLKYLYIPGSPQPPAPFPDCGVDPTADELDCEEHPCMGDRSVVRKKIGR